jgi:hypothetical protein
VDKVTGNPEHIGGSSRERTVESTQQAKLSGTGVVWLDHVIVRVEGGHVCLMCVWCAPASRLVKVTMSSDVAVRHQSTPPSPASSPTNSLDDHVNNPEARVYFGPIQSPEKILIAEAAHSWTNPSSLPVCLSPRISSPLDSHKLLSLEEDENIVREILEVETTEAPTVATTLAEDYLQDGKNVPHFGYLLC